jgi:hypothetical protein
LRHWQWAFRTHGGGFAGAIGRCLMGITKMTMRQLVEIHMHQGGF